LLCVAPFLLPDQFKEYVGQQLGGLFVRFGAGLQIVDREKPSVAAVAEPPVPVGAVDGDQLDFFEVPQRKHKKAVDSRNRNCWSGPRGG